MQQIPEGGENQESISGHSQLDETTQKIQHELDLLFTNHEELRAKRSLTTQGLALITGFIGLVMFYKDEQKAINSLALMYLPLLTSLILHRPLWKLRKLIYLYTHHGNISRKGVEDPRNQQA